MDWGDNRGAGPIAVPMILLLIVLAALGIGGGALYWKFWDAPKAVPVADDVCHCPDVPAMEKRLKEDTAAVAEYHKMIDEETEPRMWTEQAYLQGKARVSNAVTNPGGTTGYGETHGDDCTTELTSPPSDCLKAILQTHENLHSLACQAVKHSPKDPGGDYRKSMTIVTYWREEAAGYEAEMAYIRRQMAVAKLESPCFVGVETSSPTKSKEQQQQRLAGSRRRVSSYVRGIS